MATMRRGERGVMMAQTIERGIWRGARVRTARKAGRCEYWMGLSAGGRCPVIIEPGDTYFDGELTETGKAGGFARQRWCMDHACDGDVSEQA